MPRGQAERSPNTSGQSSLRVGISACLLGQAVRFDGGHKRDHFLTGVLGPHVEWVPVCPEVEMGLGTPRETLRLVRDGTSIRMITTRTSIDRTSGMHAWARGRLEALAREDLDGYVLKKDSPSCGMERVKVYSAAGTPTPTPTRDGRGLYASALLDRLPLLPVEEEGRLSDARLRENFIERLFAFRRLKNLFGARWTHGALVRFHTAHKMSLLAHSIDAYRELGRLVAQGAQLPRPQLRDEYATLFMTTMRRVATTGRHTNVLTHMAGHLKTLIDADSRQELASCVDGYRRGLVPLVVPLTLIGHHVRVHDVRYLAGQTYLDPHPREMMLRNHV